MNDGDSVDLAQYDTSKTCVLSITSGGTYTFSGSRANCRIKVDTAEPVVLNLNGVVINNEGYDVSAISIENDSQVTIHSVGASLSTLTGGAESPTSNHGGAGVFVDKDASVTFASDSHITAWGARSTTGYGHNAAGIGGAGSGNSDSGSITFEDGCTIEAHGAETGEQGGAGIGSGYDGAVHGDITIKGGTIKAYGGGYAAGIGSGDSHLSGNGGDVDGNITISGGTVLAVGGFRSAGIGSGYGGTVNGSIAISGGTVTASTQDTGAGIGSGENGDIKGAITISGGTVTAVGADGSAGIGSGKSGSTKDGTIAISHATVTATGGASGAGIGSGAKGATGEIKITSGTVSAMGGESGAGIGSGSQGDVDGNIRISGGTVSAKGGYRAAGIGSGYAGDVDESIVISGGRVTASGGSYDIGIGTDGDRGVIWSLYRPGDAMGVVYITGGTIVAENGSIYDESMYTFISGGSVSAQLHYALDDKESYGGYFDSVYQVKLPVYDASAAVQSVTTTSANSWGDAITFNAGKDLYPDEDGYLYLYLPASHNSRPAFENKTKLVQNGTTYNYRDNKSTSSDNDGELKMDGTIEVTSRGWFYWKDSDTAYLEDSDYHWAGATWSYDLSQGFASYVLSSQNSSPGAYATIGTSLYSPGAGYMLIASMTAPNKYYWGASGTASGSIVDAPTVTIADLTKTYDGEPITVDDATAAVTTYSDGEKTVTLQQQDASGNWVDVDQAVDTGHYRVSVEVGLDYRWYAPGSATQEFDILPAPTSTAVVAQKVTDGDGNVSAWTITAQVGGFVAGHVGGSVTFYSAADGKDVELGSAAVGEVGRASVQVASEGVDPGTYTVTARYSGANYADSEGSLTGLVDMFSRAITGQTTHDLTFGQTRSFTLDMGTDYATANDIWSYEVATDSYAGFAKSDGTAVMPTVSVSNDGTVTVNHAGTATIKVTLSDGADHPSYYDAIAYVTVTVNKAGLIVSGYAYGSDASQPVTTATYGSLDVLSSGLMFSYDGGETFTSDAPDWNSGFAGSLAAGAFNAQVGAGAYAVPIEQTAGTFTVNGVEHEGFFSRDYDVTFANAFYLTVAKRQIYLSVNSASGIYGGQAPSLTWSYDPSAQVGASGLASFDTESSVFAEDPALAIDAQVTDSSDFASVQVNRGQDGSVVPYADALVARGGSSDNYDVIWIAGDLTVDPAELTVTTASASKAYDGTPLEAAEGCSLEGLVAGETATLTVTGSQTDVGESDNGYAIEWGTARESNYEVASESLGTLSVAPNASLVTFAASSASKTYDGAALESAGVSAEGLPSAVTYEAEASGNQTDAGSSPNAVASYKIVDASGKDVTSYFANVSTASGELAVAPAPLTVSTPSASKAYDGTPLEAAEGCSLEGLVAGETATLAATGSQTEVGSSPNTYEIVWDGTARESNYGVASESLGTLTVTAATPAPTPGSDGDDGDNGQELTGNGSFSSVNGSVDASQPSAGSSSSTPATGDAPLGVAAAVAAVGALCAARAAFRRAHRPKR